MQVERVRAPLRAEADDRARLSLQPAKMVNAPQSGGSVRLVCRIEAANNWLEPVLTFLSFATPSPSADTLSTSHRSITYTDSTGSATNPSAVALGKPDCTVPMSCSTFTLTIGIYEGKVRRRLTF